MSSAGGVGSCVSAGRIDNGLGVRNEEQGNSVYVCRRMPQSWAQVWPTYRHYD
jgi:hypothetical protein